MAYRQRSRPTATRWSSVLTRSRPYGGGQPEGGQTLISTVLLSALQALAAVQACTRYDHAVL